MLAITTYKRVNQGATFILRRSKGIQTVQPCYGELNTYAFTVRYIKQETKVIHCPFQLACSHRQVITYRFSIIEVYILPSINRW